MFKKIMLAVILCTGLVGCKGPKTEEPEETQVTETETVEEENTESETNTEPEEGSGETVIESAPPAEGITVDEDATYEFEEDTDYIIN